mmetsp:Transcript_106982/g.299437  ORF Transcript_106982/g.299437 Transcript_106982/m.299437 type:complete len:83 (+) Transcript_106982:143-391(+)
MRTIASACSSIFEEEEKRQTESTVPLYLFKRRGVVLGRTIRYKRLGSLWRKLLWKKYVPWTVLFTRVKPYRLSCLRKLGNLV